MTDLASIPALPISRDSDVDWADTSGDGALQPSEFARLSSDQMSSAFWSGMKDPTRRQTTGADALEVARLISEMPASDRGTAVDALSFYNGPGPDVVRAMFELHDAPKAARLLAEAAVSAPRYDGRVPRWGGDASMTPAQRDLFARAVSDTPGAVRPENFHPEPLDEHLRHLVITHDVVQIGQDRTENDEAWFAAKMPALRAAGVRSLLLNVRPAQAQRLAANTPHEPRMPNDFPALVASARRAGIDVKVIEADDDGNAERIGVTEHAAALARKGKVLVWEEHYLAEKTGVFGTTPELRHASVHDQLAAKQLRSASMLMDASPHGSEGARDVHPRGVQTAEAVDTREFGIARWMDQPMAKSFDALGMLPSPKAVDAR